MQDLKSLKERLAREQAGLAAAQQQIAAAETQIEAAQQQVQELNAKIEELREGSAAIEKRMALLRQYIEMVEAGEGGAAAAAGEAADAGGSPLEDFPDLEADAGEFGDLNLEPPTPAVVQPGPDVSEEDTLTFETVDERRLSLEILPRTHSFEEELLLLMAHHKKAIKPSELAKIFRRWEYSPRGPATEKGIKAQLDSDHHFFEEGADGRYALTEEGRQEAQNLFNQIST